MSMQPNKRRHILSQSEISEQYCLPRLNNIQREQAFSLTDGGPVEEVTKVSNLLCLNNNLQPLTASLSQHASAIFP